VCCQNSNENRNFCRNACMLFCCLGRALSSNHIRCMQWPDAPIGFAGMSSLRSTRPDRWLECRMRIKKNLSWEKKKHTEAVCLVCFGGEIIGLKDLPILQLFQFHLVFWRTLSPKKIKMQWLSTLNMNVLITWPMKNQ